jgi:hypothetical protein
MKITPELVESMGLEVVRSKSSQEEIVVVCTEPGCTDRSGHRGINTKTGKTNCWICNKGGLFTKWARRQGFEVDDIDENQHKSLEEIVVDKRPDKMLVAYSSDIKLPEGYTLIKDAPKSVYTRMIEEMAVRKNLDRETFERAGVGFTKTDYRWEPYAIFPVIEWDRVVYFQGRTYRDKPGETTKKFPSRKDAPYGARHWLYNIDKLRQGAHTAIVVESMLNVLSLENEIRKRGWKGIVPVAIFKHKISQEQMVKLLSCRKLKEVCLMFDDDATADAQASTAGLTNTIRVSVAEMPYKVDPNDNAELACDIFMKRAIFDRPVSELKALADRL